MVSRNDAEAARAVLRLGDPEAIAVELAALAARWISQDFPGGEEEILAVMRQATDLG
jgi:hypothetical protein